MPHLVDLDHHLGRIGRNDQHVGMSLHQDAGLFFVGVSQSLAGFDGFGKTGVKVLRLRNANTVGTFAAEIGQAVADFGIKAIHGLGQHKSEGVLARARRAGKDHRLWKAIARQHLAQVMNHIGVAVKIGKAHVLPFQRGGAESATLAFTAHFSLPRTISNIFACVSFAVPRALTTATRRGSRAAMAW